jgi:hypothetical protein
MAMQRVDRIEKRRFVGRELLLLLWMESELFESTLSTDEHGTFGLWLEKKLVLSAGSESTRITAAMPGVGRDAKEALLRGQLPESMGIRIAWKDDETSLALSGEKLGITGLKLSALVEEPSENVAGDLVDELLGARKGKPKKKKAPVEETIDDSPFYDRMSQTAELEGLLAALYREFLTLRLSSKWDGVVVPAMTRWAMGKPVDVDAYRQGRRFAQRAPREQSVKRGKKKAK